MRSLAYTNDNGNLIFRFDKFEPIKLYLCSHSTCQCHLIYAQKNIETHTATKYFISGTYNFTLDLYPFGGNDALRRLVFWKNCYFFFTHWIYWLHFKMDVLWERRESMMSNNNLKKTIRNEAFIIYIWKLYCFFTVCN